MVTLKCYHCGHEIEVSESVRSVAIRCARCGHELTPNLPGPAPGTEIGLPVFKPHGDSQDSGETTRNQPSDGDTFVPGSLPPADLSFAFLSAPRGPDELGWLKHYRVVRLIGQGGMGIVFEAVDTELERTVALKVMKPEIAEDELARQRFLREAKAMAAVKSDYIVTVYQVGVHKNVPFLATELLKGEPLDRWLAQRTGAKLDDVLRLGIDIGRGLAAAHESGLIHRDIKPANIWLEAAISSQQSAVSTERPNLLAADCRLPTAFSRARILDFGLARLNRDTSVLTQPGIVMGTPAYMAPEQVEGAAVDARCDLFSLGCVLYEMATHAPAFSGANSMMILMAVATRHPRPPREVNPDLPPPLAKLILQLLAKKPQDRPASAREVVETLQSIANQVGVNTDTPPLGQTRARVNRPRRRLWFALGAAVLGVMLMAAVAWQLFGPRGDPPPAAGQGIGAEVRLGTTGPFHGPAGELGRELKIGIDTYFKHVNDQGGIAGRKLHLTALDDGYEPERALANLRDLHEKHRVFATIANVGTPSAAKTVPFALEKKQLFFGAYTGAKLLRRDPPDRYVFNYRASLEEETAGIVEYLLNVRGVRPDQIAVFAQNDGYGDDAFHGVIKMLRPYGRDEKDILRVGYERNSSNIEDAVQKILGQPEVRAIVMVPIYGQAAAFVKKIKDDKPDMIFASVSFVGSEALADRLLELGPHYADGVIVTQVVPPLDSQARLVFQYHDLLKKYHPSERASSTSLEGFIDAALLVKGLERAGTDLNTDTLIDALESLHNVDLGLGPLITFGPSEHQASHKVWGTQLGKDGRYRVLDGFK